MKNPCKRCIVQPACSKSCKEYDKFLNFASDFSVFASLVISCLIMSPILLHLGYLIDQGKEWASMTIVMLWIISFMVSTCLQASLDEDNQVGFSARLLFAPFISICFIFFHLAKPYCKRGGT